MAGTPATAAGTLLNTTRSGPQVGWTAGETIGTSQTSTTEGRPATAGCSNSIGSDARNSMDVNIL
jgi:hypothetical protein